MRAKQLILTLVLLQLIRSKSRMLWNYVIKTLMGHFLYNANSGFGDMFHTMFADTVVAQKFNCSSTKLAYLFIMQTVGLVIRDVFEK